MSKKDAKSAKQWPIVRRIVAKNGTESWLVDTRINGKGSRIFKPTEAQANEVAKLARAKRQMSGGEYFSMSNSQREDAERALDLLIPVGKTLLEAAIFYVSHLKALTASQTVSKAAEAYEQSIIARGMSDRYKADVSRITARFSDKFGKRLIAEISVDDVDNWLTSLKVSAVTSNSRRRILVGLFAFAAKRGWCDGEAAKKSAIGKEKPSPIGILDVDRMSWMLNSADKAILPGLAIGAFAGLRSAEVARLDWKHVDLQDRLIEVTAENAKTSKRRLVAISENLAEWLKPLAETSGKVWPQSRRVVRRLFNEARAPRPPLKWQAWPDNALRHSFASYHLAKHHDAAKLALEMGHKKTDIIFDHYRQLVKPADADKYWQIQPRKK